MKGGGYTHRWVVRGTNMDGGTNMQELRATRLHWTERTERGMIAAVLGYFQDFVFSGGGGGRGGGGYKRPEDEP